MSVQPFRVPPALALLAASMLAVPPALAGDTLAIEGARVFDGIRVHEQATLVLRDGAIESFGPAGSVDVPADARRIDYRGKTIVPGLISNHAHVGNSDGAEHGRQFYTRDVVLRDLRQFQAYGVTTVVALGLNAPLYASIRDEVRGGDVAAADFFSAGAGIGVEGGAPPKGRMNIGDDQAARPADADEARAVVRKMAAPPRVDVVKLWMDDMGGDAPDMAEAVYTAAIEESHRQGLKVAAHIHDLEPARALLEAGVDIIAHGVRDQRIDHAFAALMRERDAAYVATIQIDEAEYIFAQHPEWLDDPFVHNAMAAEFAAQVARADWRREQLGDDDAAGSREAVANNQANLLALHQAGVRLGFGTDSGALPQRVVGFAEHRELELMVEAGLRPVDALRIATAGAADVMGWSDRGVIEPGRRADFVVLDADPLQDIRNTRGIHAVWQHGEQVSGPVADYRRPGR